MTQFLAVVPGVLAAWVAFRKSPVHAYLDVYLPVLLLLPDYYQCKLPGLPDPTPNQAAIVAIAIALAVKGAGRWRCSFTDVLVFGYAWAMAYSEYINKDYAEAQNLAFEVLASIILPYLLTKMLVEPKGLRVVFAQRLVLLLAIVVGVSLWEFRMGRPLFKILLGPFFPGQGNWPDTFRYGFTRVAGPYGHAILAGVIFASVYRLAKWLEWTGHWPERVKLLPVRVSKARLYALILAGGALMTLCRGPWIGAFMGAVVMLIARAKNRTVALAIALALGVGLGTPAALAFKAYVSVGREGAKTAEQETAAYRKELLDKYTEIAGERYWFGWGRNGWPIVPGMPSIDNNYLLLFLNHGIMAVLLLLAIFVWMMVRLLLYGAARPKGCPDGLLLFSLMGVYLCTAVSVATVYMGEQVVHLLFLFTGWAEGVILQKRPAAAPAPLFRFQRVLA